jgi:hypothetical protein
MLVVGMLFVGVLRDWFKSRRRLQAEILILRHQLNILLSLLKIISGRSNDAGRTELAL